MSFWNASYFNRARTGYPMLDRTGRVLRATSPFILRISSSCGMGKTAHPFNGLSAKKQGRRAGWRIPAAARSLRNFRSVLFCRAAKAAEMKRATAGSGQVQAEGVARCHVTLPLLLD